MGSRRERSPRGTSMNGTSRRAGMMWTRVVLAGSTIRGMAPLDVRPGETISFVVKCTPHRVILKPVSRID